MRSRRSGKPRLADSGPAWIPCDGCDEWWCRIHEQHVCDCECPVVDEWQCDPYTSGGPPAYTHSAR